MRHDMPQVILHARIDELSRLPEHVRWLLQQRSGIRRSRMHDIGRFRQALP